MNALDELKKRTRVAANPANPANPANSANSANQERKQTVDSHDSHDSQGVDTKEGVFAPSAESLKAERTRLLALAAAEWIDAAHVYRLQDADLADWITAGLDDGLSRVFLHATVDTAERHAGRVPEPDTAGMYCQRCGPVWTHPDIAAVLPEVNGWPRALGCPWCVMRKVDVYVPRPTINCGDCLHFTPDPINPTAGMGTCGSGHGFHYPMTEHRCISFRLDGAQTASATREAADISNPGCA